MIFGKNVIGFKVKKELIFWKIYLNIIEYLKSVKSYDNLEFFIRFVKFMDWGLFVEIFCLIFVVLKWLSSINFIIMFFIDILNLKVSMEKVFNE